MSLNYTKPSMKVKMVPNKSEKKRLEEIERVAKRNKEGGVAFYNGQQDGFPRKNNK